MKSEQWKTIRLEVLKRYKFKCVRCGYKPRNLSKLHVHHLTYERFGKEEPKDLELLCADCHTAEHKDKKPILTVRQKLVQKVIASKKKKKKGKRKLVDSNGKTWWYEKGSISKR